MKSKILNSLISEVTKKAYQNYHEWMQSDVDIASQLRDGIRMASSAFDEIEPINDRISILKEMKDRIQEVLKYYRSLPGEAGTWECSALSIIDREINRLISEN
ncbi:MAG: hypothetical protein K9N09_03105 [Candidatus Cloacimonetes bacterium]|nr:hypothetical protein [Candidatus Cloacimonadota bacterium]MCF7883538.1 hypothetical protein [Candidatus Cloacimonadota bacterium]